VITSVILFLIIIPVGVVVSKKNDGKGTGLGHSNSLNDMDPNSIPASARGTYLDPFTWLDVTDFNLTYTNATVGDLPIMGLFDDYDDSARANDRVPPLNEPFQYGKMPVRGVNLGGWLLIEPFITPSFFEGYPASKGVVDEFTLSQYLGPNDAKSVIEKHYSEFVNEDTFKEICDAGLDHVRIPFGYWAVEIFDGDAFVFRVSWRYLLRSIEWARKYGLRVNLDLHSVPGGQNGWNHSGRQGVIGWLIGPNGDLNGDRTLAIHARLAKFFSQPRYKNIVTMYGLVNEPRMDTLNVTRVMDWTEQAYHVVRDAGFKDNIIFGDGFRGLDKWKGAFTTLDGMLLDVHEYVIFNTQLISLTKRNKIKFACDTWSNQLVASLDTSTG
jgi:glucan 1,3-beta-glucosidase